VEFFIQQIITGISIGGIYALLAVGYALIYSVFDFSNFAFGCIMMVSAFTCYYCNNVWMIGQSLFSDATGALLINIAVAILAGIVLSVLIELVAYRPMRKMGSGRLYLMITGMGINLAVVNTATVKLGANARAINLGSFNMQSFDLAEIRISKLDIFALLIALGSLAILYVFLNKTKTGLGIRASAYSTSIAGLMGINVNRISLTIFIISGITSGIAGVFCGMKYAVNPTVGSAPALKAFIASVIGGLGSIQGAVVGGIVLGIVETYVSGFISSVYRDLFSYGILILVLFFMPGGLLGRLVQDKI
jgi:branched-chain amino acid transport system permease protein